MEKVSIFPFRDSQFSEDRQVNLWIFLWFSAHHCDLLTGSGYCLTVPGQFTVAIIVYVKTQRPWAATLSYDTAHNVDKGSGKDTSLVYLDRHLVLAWLREKIWRDTGAIGIMKSGDRGHHSDNEVTPVENNCRKHTVVSRSKLPFGTKWRLATPGAV